MAYDLKPTNPDAGPFQLGAFSWGPLVEACGYLWPLATRGGQWYCVWGADPRLGTEYPLILSNDGMAITDEEARIMARCARNLVTVQRSLPEENADKSLIGQTTIKRDNLIEALQKTMHGIPLNERWPVKIRPDFVDKYEKFAEWADRSGGFTIH